MSKTTFEASVLLVGAAFTIAFGVIVVPALIESGDIAGAFAAGFVNPFASGYSLDTILCAVILMVWVLYERSSLGIRHGWGAIPLSIIPGVAPAFAIYLVIRSRQLSARGGD